jgi:hypothetical protein
LNEDIQHLRQHGVRGWICRHGAATAGIDMELPCEVQLMVRDAALPLVSFTEFIRLGQVCRAWRDSIDYVFKHWLAAQPFGVPLPSFAGSAGEIRFVRHHVDGK